MFKAKSTIGIGAALLLLLAGACSPPSPTVGPDARNRTNASQVTWSDGKPAYSITCDLPGGCQTRAMALCQGKSYAVLQSSHMTSIGTRLEVPESGSVVIRCS